MSESPMAMVNRSRPKAPPSTTVMKLLVSHSMRYSSPPAVALSAGQVAQYGVDERACLRSHLTQVVALYRVVCRAEPPGAARAVDVAQRAQRRDDLLATGRAGQRAIQHLASVVGGH